MRLLFLTLAIGLLLCPRVRAQTANSEADRPLTYYLPDLDYDESVTTPEEFLGWQIGDWHISHDLQQAYVRRLAQESDRLTLREIGRSYEDRPLLNLIVTTPENHSRLEELRRAHVDLRQRGVEDVPGVLYQGFSIHGNEPSGGNAAVLVAYYLAAAPLSELEALLDNNVVIVDPCYNPDGFNRFASWVNTHKNKSLTADGQDREYNEAYPRGRTNHYWFDLNRDWLPVQHPESRARIAQFQRWLPNVLTDHHEMGKDATFFFMPGEPTRVHPMTPAINQELTAKIGAYHADALDGIGSLYYSGEGYDDFYYGKGSTYPDIHGTVGILFEQASSRGHLQATENGELAFPFTVRNQVVTALSTQAAFADLRDELLSYQRDFRRGGQTREGYIFEADDDPGRAAALAELLSRHNVRVLQENAAQPGAYWVEATPFVQSAFEPISTFSDSLFYDVSTFVLPYAFNLPYRKGSAPGGYVALGTADAGQTYENGWAEYAYLLPWDDYYAGKALYRLQAAGANAKVSSRPFSVLGGVAMDAGAVMIPVSNNQPLAEAELHALVAELEEETGIDCVPVSSGSVDAGSGLMLGSRSAYRPLRKPEVALLVGGGTRSYDAGEVWHLLDQRFGIPVTKLNIDDWRRVDLSRYNTIIMVNGNYKDLDASKLKEWMGPGRVLITQQGAARWAADNGLSKAKFRTSQRARAEEGTYGMASRDRGGQVLGGAIFEAEGDLTHPLLYGLERAELPVFKRGRLLMEPAKNPYATPLRYRDNAYLSGYSPRGFEEDLGGTAGAVVSNVGGGRSISFADNLNFRAFWYGTSRVFMNAVFFGDTIDSAAAE